MMREAIWTCMLVAALVFAPKAIQAAEQTGVAVTAGTDAPDHAFTLARPSKVTFVVTNARPAAWAGLLRVDCFDLLTEKTGTEFIACKLAAGGKAEIVYRPKLLFGIYRLTGRAVAAKGDAAVGPGATITVAYGPARLARELPDDWPLGTHHYNPSPVLKAPMPGFKWYRYFASWAHLNPRKGVYDWKDLDATIADIKAVGGRMLLAFEGAPAWTSKRATDGKARESRFAPDDMNDYRTFLRELLKRHADGGVLGAAEVWNEFNANMRWRDTPAKLVEMHKVTFEETRATGGRIKVVGISISPGHHVGYVENLTERGVLKYLDIVGGHFYEEIGSLNRLNPRNSMPLHVDLLRIPIRREKRYLPIWDTESGMGWEGVNGGPRLGGRMVGQDERVRELRKRPNFDPNEPWRLWPASSERRMAARVVSATISLLGYGVEKHFTFHPNWYSFDKALNLPWVANAALGSVLEQVDFRYVMPLGVNAVGGPADIGAVAYRLGKPGGKHVVVVWAERASTKHPHAGGWSNWIAPVAIQLPCAAGAEVTVQDMYLRTSTKVKAAKCPGGEAVLVRAGEEPVFVWDWKFRDQ